MNHVRKEKRHFSWRSIVGWAAVVVGAAIVLSPSSGCESRPDRHLNATACIFAGLAALVFAVIAVRSLDWRPWNVIGTAFEVSP
jgi:hypothetical protein